MKKIVIKKTDAIKQVWSEKPELTPTQVQQELARRGIQVSRPTIYKVKQGLSPAALKDLSKMSRNEKVDWATGTLILSIGDGTFSKKVAQIVDAISEEAYNRGIIKGIKSKGYLKH